MNFKIIKYIVSKFAALIGVKFNDVYFVIITNGTILSDEILLFCIKNRIKLQITIDGDKYAHDQQRKTFDGHSTYDLILKNIELLQKNNINYYPRVTITSNTLAAEKLINDFKDNKIHNIYCGLVCPVDGVNICELLLFDIDSYLDGYFDSFIKDMNDDCDFYYSNIAGAVNNFISTIPKKTCGVSTSKITLKHDGRLFSCHKMINHSELSIGDIWSGKNERYDELYYSIADLNNNCKKCYYLHFMCGGPCFFEVVKRNDFDYVNHDLCRFNKKINTLTIKYFIHNYLPNRELYDKFLQKYGHLYSGLKFLENKKDNLMKVRFDYVFLKADGVNIVDFQEEGLIFNKKNYSKKYIVNVTTMAIWDLIDGNISAQEIALKIAGACDVKIEDIENDIYQNLAALQELGLIDESALQQVNQ